MFCTKFLFTFHYTIYFRFVKRYYYLLLVLSRTYKYTCYCLYCLTPCVFLSYSIHFATLHSFHNPEPPHFIGAIRLSEKQVFRPIYIFIVKCFLLFLFFIKANNTIATCNYFFSFLMRKIPCNFYDFRFASMDLRCLLDLRYFRCF